MTFSALPVNAPPLRWLLDRATVVMIPTRTRFRGITVREAVLWEGSHGATEFSPFPEYDDAHAARWLQAALHYGWAEAPAPHLSAVPVNATVPALEPDAVPGVLARFAGCTTVKVKVAEAGQNLEADIARVRAVRETLGPKARIRIDANGAWSLAAATAALKALAEFKLDYAEQPCATVAELGELKRRELGTLIAADESVRRATDPLLVAKEQAADLLIVKAQPLGGIATAMQIIAAAGLPVVVSSALDTSVGISMGAHLAAALPAGTLHGACGLGTVALLQKDVVHDSLLPRAGMLPVTRPRLHAELLAQLRAPAARQHWWRERISRCYALLENACA